MKNKNIKIPPIQVWPFWKILSFNRTQRLSLIALIICTLLVIGFELYSSFSKKDSSQDFLAHQEKLIQLQLQYEQSLDTADIPTFTKKKYQGFYTKEYEKQNLKDEKPKSNSIVSININKAKKEDWQQLKGIGPVLSERIVKYRSRLGGFVSKTQLKEVYGISDSLYRAIEPQLQPSKSTVKKLDINLAPLDSLKSHPYLKDNWAAYIVNYRTKVKSFKTLEDLKQLKNMTDSTFNKITPYLIVANP